jgi:transposase
VLLSNWSVSTDWEVSVTGFWVVVPESLWREAELVLPVPERRFRYPGRKRYPDRLCLEGILTVLRWGIPWKNLPQVEGRPSGKTCWRRFDEWQKAGVWPMLVERLQLRLAQANRFDWQRAILDSTIVAAKRGAPKSAKTLPIAAVRPQSSTSPATGEGRHCRSG